MAVKFVTRGKSIRVLVEKGEEVYVAEDGALYESWTGTRKEFDEALKAAAADERDHDKNEKAAATAHDAAVKAESERLAAAGTF